MTNINNNLDQWEDIYKKKGPGSFLKYPNEMLATLFFRYKKYFKTDGKCLDYGFGSGNNSELLIEHMKNLYGVEISESAIKAIDERLSGYKNFEKNNFSLTMTEDFNDFDLIVAWQVLYYNTKESFYMALDKLYSALKRGGIMIISLSTHSDIKVVSSKQIAENTFQIGKAIPHQEGCIIYSPSSEDDFLNCFTKYNLEIIDYGYFENMSKISNSKLSEYYLVAKKA